MRAHGGVWILRMEDIDTLRTAPGADRMILETLDAFRIISDEAVLYQSARTASYREALKELQASGWAYPCSCSRKTAGPGPYPDT